ncbi:hypothetical protein K2Z84_20755 [Candidatus Binatia bacterium]|nr:hypothetical protein [Candidatus Binatia bacterium]
MTTAVRAADSSLIASIGWRSTNGRHPCVTYVKHQPLHSDRAARMAARAPAVRTASRQRFVRRAGIAEHHARASPSTSRGVARGLDAALDVRDGRCVVAHAFLRPHQLTFEHRHAARGRSGLALRGVV